MAFAQPRRRGAAELGVVLQLGDGGVAGIAHGGAQPADELVDDVGGRPLVGDPAFDAFGDEIETVGYLFLEVPVGRPPGHGAEGAHAAIGFVRPALEQEHLARAFVGAGEQGPDHAAFGARRDGLGQVAGILDAAVGDERDFGLPARLRRLDDGRELRHADAGDHARRADGAGPDADLDAIGAGVDQRPGAVGGGDVAADHLDIVGKLLDLFHRLQDGGRMAVRGVDDDDVDASIEQRLGPGDAVVADAGGRGDPEASLFVLAGVGVCLGLFHVLDRDQADAAERAVDD